MSKEQQAVVDRYRKPLRDTARSVANCPVATCPLLSEMMGMIQCTDQASHFSLNYQANNMSLTNFVHQLDLY